MEPLRANATEIALLPAFETRPIDVVGWDLPDDGLLSQAPPAADPRPVADRVGSESVRVVILGSGIDVCHPALSHAVGDVRDFTKSPSKGADVIGHGTFTAGVVAGRRSHRWPGGYCPTAKVYSGKVIADTGHGSAESVAKGLRWAAELQADLCLVQVEMVRGDRRMLAALHKAFCAGTTLVAPAGNSFSGNTAETWPGKSDAVLSVSGVWADGSPDHTSCFGPDLALAAWAGPRTSLWPGRRLATLRGTGVAAAMATGVAAAVVGRLKRCGSGTAPDDVRRELFRHCRPADATAPAAKVGYGVLWPARWVASLPPAHLERQLQWAAEDALENDRRRRELDRLASPPPAAGGPPDEPI